MPIYRYRCAAGHETESLERMGTGEIRCEHGVDHGPDPCGLPAAKIAQTSLARPLGGPTPIHYPGRGAN
jgi:hypothetical protein